MEIQSTQKRLDSILETVKRKNTALKTLIETISIPPLSLELSGKLKKTQTLKPASVSFSKSRQRLQGSVFPSPEMEQDVSSYLSRPKQSVGILTKEHYPCQIPVLVQSVPKGLLKHKSKYIFSRSKSPKRNKNRLYPSLILE
jgi:hypothetical protein